MNDSMMQKMMLTVMVFLVGISSAVFSQQPVADEFTTFIRIRGRYLENEGVELRFFPEKRLVMETGFREGFVIERSPGGEDQFEEVARLFPFEPDEWDQVMDGAEGETYDWLDLARGYLEISRESRGGAFDFDSGIRDMRQQRADEDFDYAVFMLTAAREALVAEALGLSYTDADAEPGMSYTYRVLTATAPPVYNLEPAPYNIVAAPDENIYENPVYFYEGDTWINFVWEEDEQLALYEVERRNPGEDHFVKLTDAPLINLRGKDYEDVERGSFRDENLENYTLYTYRFYGQNIFGERILFAEVEAMPRDRTPPEPPRILTLEHHLPEEVLLEWEMNDPPAPDLMGFVVGRGESPEGDFEIVHPRLLSDQARSFTDTTFVEGQSNYYVVQAVDTAFNVSSSLPVAVTLIDTIPPAQPLWLSGTVDSLGVVTLEVEKNSEQDLMGYRLFKANDPDHEFSVIFEGFVDNDSLREEIPTLFTDTITLNSLTPKVYYKVKALDFNFNQSADSEMMVIERPDTIPPTTPVFKRVISRTDEIELHFALSGSNDVVSHGLYRKTDLSDPWEPYAALETGQTRYIDTEAAQEVTYYYSIRATDHSGLHSDFARPVYGKAYDDGVRPPVENLALVVADNGLILRWDYPSGDADTFFIVYAVDEQGRVRQYARTSELFVGGDPEQARNGGYAVKVFTADGGSSSLSETVALDVE